VVTPGQQNGLAQYFGSPARTDVTICMISDAASMPYGMRFMRRTRPEDVMMTNFASGGSSTCQKLAWMSKQIALANSNANRRYLSSDLISCCDL
jgi:glutathione synthase/RimK-type ligase-like ATP-grasp enzyme